MVIRAVSLCLLTGLRIYREILLQLWVMLSLRLISHQLLVIKMCDVDIQYLPTRLYVRHHDILPVHGHLTGKVLEALLIIMDDRQ